MEKKPRPKTVPCSSHKISVGCGNMYITVGVLDDQPFEVFAVLGKAGTCTKAQTEALTRMVSLALQHGVPVKEIVEQLQDIRCQSPTHYEGELVQSCSDAISKVLARTHVESAPLPMA